jgi:hypothetical protein
MYPRLFLTILPALLGAIAPSLALPVKSSDSVSVEARSFGLSPDATLLVSRDFDAKLVVERGYQDDELDVLTRAIDEHLFPRATRPKRTAAEAHHRKEAVRTKIATNQAHNAAKKIELQAKTAALPPGHRYGKPRKPSQSYKKETTAKGKTHIVSGFRANGRKIPEGESGHRIAKQPKTPKPNFAKGDHLTNAKAVQKQAEAKTRLQAKKTAGRNAHATANTRYAQTLAHGNMPNRHDEYHVPNHGVLHGKDVRTGAYNLGMHDGQGGRYPVTFRNDLQGKPTNRHRPLPHMVGTGHEYPINNAKHGYHPDAAQGPVRGIYQNNPGGGYNVQGVIAHDVTLAGKPEDEGYNDHHQIHGVPAPARLEGAGGTIFPSHR